MTPIELYNEISVQQMEQLATDGTHIYMELLLMCQLIISVQKLTDKLEDIERVLNSKS